MNVQTTHATKPDEKSLLGRAQDALGQAVESTVEAVKDHPVAAAAIAGGVAAAAAGAAFGVQKLRDNNGSSSKA